MEQEILHKVSDRINKFAIITVIIPLGGEFGSGLKYAEVSFFGLLEKRVANSGTLITNISPKSP